MGRPEGLKGPLHSLPCMAARGPPTARCGLTRAPALCPQVLLCPPQDRGAGHAGAARIVVLVHPHPRLCPPPPPHGPRRTRGPLGGASALQVASQEGPWPHVTGGLGFPAQPGTQASWPRTRAAAPRPPGAGLPLLPPLTSTLAAKAPTSGSPTSILPRNPWGAPLVWASCLFLPPVISRASGDRHVGDRQRLGRDAGRDGWTDGRTAGFPPPAPASGGN